MVTVVSRNGSSFLRRLGQAVLELLQTPQFNLADPA